MPMILTGGQGFRFPSADEIRIAGEWMDKSSDLYKSAMDGKPISRSQKQVLKKLGTVFSPSALLGNMSSYGAVENPGGVGRHRLLRQAAEQSIIDSLIILARQHQVSAVSKRVIIEDKQKGWNVVHKRHSDPSYSPDSSVQDRCNAVEEFLSHPRKDVHPGGLRDFFMRAVEGELILDRKVMIVERDRRFRPLGFHLIPPDDVKPRPEVLLPEMARLRVMGNEGEGRAVESIYRKWGVDVADAAYIQMIDGAVTGAWRAEEISVDITLPSSELDHWFYGRSCLDRSLALTTLLLHAFHYNEAQFTVAWPEAILALKGDVSQEDLNAFRSQIYAYVGQQGNQRLPVVNLGEDSNGAELLKLRDSMRDMQYAELIRLVVALKVSAYRAHPSLLNMAPDNGSVAPLISNADQETNLALAQEEGLHALLGNLARWFTTELVEPLDPELEMTFNVQDLPTPAQQVEIWSKKLQNGYTIDEFRASQGDVTLAEATNGRVSGDYVNSQFFFEQQQQLMQELQAQAQTDMPEEPGQPDNAQLPGAADAQNTPPEQNQ